MNAALADCIISCIAIPSATIGYLPSFFSLPRVSAHYKKLFPNFKFLFLGWLANLNDWKIIESLQWGSVILVLFVTAPSLAATAVDFQLQIVIGPERYM